MDYHTSLVLYSNHVVELLIGYGYKLGEEILNTDPPGKRDEIWGTPRLTTHEFKNLVGPVFGGGISQEWIKRLTAPPQDLAWHLIRYNTDDCLLIERMLDIDYCFPHTAHSFAHAIASSIHAITDNGIRVHDVKKDSDGRIIFEHQAGVLLTIEKLPFAPIDEKQLDQVNKALEGVCYSDPDEHIKSAFSSVSGLESITLRTPSCETYEPSFATFATDANNICSNLLRILKEKFNIPVTLSHAKEITAAVIGYETWEHLKNAERNLGQNAEIPFFVRRNYEDGQYPFSETQHTGFTNALIEFGRLLPLSDKKHHDISFSGWFPLVTIDGGLCLDVHDDVSSRSTESELQSVNKMIESGTLVDDLKFLFDVNDKSPEQWLVDKNKKKGVSEEDYFFHAGWAYWISSPSKHAPEELIFYAENLYPTSDSDLYDERHAVSINDCRLEQKKDGFIYIVNTKYSNYVPLPLAQLTVEAAKHIEQRFFPKSNWNFACQATPTLIDAS